MSDCARIIREPRGYERRGGGECRKTSSHDEGGRKGRRRKKPRKGLCVHQSMVVVVARAKKDKLMLTQNCLACSERKFFLGRERKGNLVSY